MAQDLPALKPDVILDLARQFRADTSGKKVDLGETPALLKRREGGAVSSRSPYESADAC